MPILNVSKYNKTTNLDNVENVIRANKLTEFWL